MSKKEKKTNTGTRKMLAFLKFSIAFAILVIAGLSYFYLNGYADTIRTLKNEAKGYALSSTPETFRQSETSLVYDCNGKLISTIKAEVDSYYVGIDEIPVYVKQAIISIEDKKFYTHKGYDMKAIVRASYEFVRKKGQITQGGSTITQQLARNCFLTREKTWERKVEEIYLASFLEQKYSKDQILEFYLNDIYFANGFYGIQAASKGYFNREVKDLTLSEIAFLCAIPNNPTTYNPIENIENTYERRDRILRNMNEDGYISDAMYEAALSETIVLNMQKKIKHNYMETFTYSCATKILMEQDGFEFRYSFNNDIDSERYANRYNEYYSYYNSKLFSGGYRIYTSLDMNMQEQLQKSLDDRLGIFNEVGEDGVYELQGAAVCIENSTGQVKAIVGGRSQELDGYTLNRGYQSYRQPGSSIKPLIVYTPILEKGFNADTVVVDREIEDGPENVDGEYWGEMPLKVAVEFSRNTVAWQIFELLTPKQGMSYLKKMNFSKIAADDERMAACLGGLTYGVTPLEMAAGYSTISNDGLYRIPTCIVKITDADGKLIYLNGQQDVEIYEKNAARQMTDILTGVITEGTAKGYGLTNMPSAGKTGTTNSRKDGWFVGYTPYYTTSVWVGYDMPRRMENLEGGSYPLYIWHDYMEEIHKNLPYTEFKTPLTYTGELQEETPVSRYDENGNIIKGTRDQTIEERWQKMLEEMMEKETPGRVNDENGEWNGEDFVTNDPQDLQNLPPGTEIFEVVEY